MFNRYYQEQLALLKDLGAEFSKAHPALAPMLSGQTSDPDVERLLEGTAFLTGLIRHKLDDEFPELLHGLMNHFFPHYLRPIPSSSILAFTPRQSLREQITVPAGTEVASTPLDGTSCIFRTCFDIDVLPLRIKNAILEQPVGASPSISVTFEISGIPLASWHPEKIRLYLSGGIPQGSDLYYHLINNTESVIFSSPEGEKCVLPPSVIKPVGFGESEPLLPYPSHAFPAYRIIQEYFMLPEKFLFVDITGFDKWQKRGSGSSFTVSFSLKEQDTEAPLQVKQDSFVLFATPIVNLFEHDADPIRYDHLKSRYLVRPSGADPKQYQVVEVKSVSGFQQGSSRPRDYISFQQFTPQYEANAVYNITKAKSLVDDSMETYISVAYPGVDNAPVEEVLSVRLLCTNGALPERLGLGDISRQTSTSPEILEFSNIRQITMTIQPPLESHILWRLLSHLSVNAHSLARPDALKALLDLYLFTDGRDRTTILANKKRIAGIQGVSTEYINRLSRGNMLRGVSVNLSMNMENFAGVGDMCLFSAILDRFLGWTSAVNSFTSLSVTEANTGEIYRWPARLGEHFLI